MQDIVLQSGNKILICYKLRDPCLSELVSDSVYNQSTGVRESMSVFKGTSILCSY
jgi:hypothetical protein